jgi:hypothetical protein
MQRLAGALIKFVGFRMMLVEELFFVLKEG